MDLRTKILSEAFQQFSRYGIKSITMDDMARHLSISKKTLYEHFEDKDSLVTEAMSLRIKNLQRDILKIQKESDNAIDEMMKCTEYANREFKGVNPAAMHDMRKYHAKAWEVLQNHKLNFFKKIVEANLKSGISEGLYRDDLDLQIVILKRMYEMDMCLSPDVFPTANFSFERVQSQVMDLFLHGIATLKGHKLINKYKKIEEN